MVVTHKFCIAKIGNSFFSPFLSGLVLAVLFWYDMRVYASACVRECIDIYLIFFRSSQSKPPILFFIVIVTVVDAVASLVGLLIL